MQRNMVDLTVPVSNQTVGVHVRLQENLPVYLGHKCYAYDMEFKSHHGTYFESPSHLFKGAKDTCDYSPAELWLPGVCLHLNSIQSRCIDAEELEAAAKGIKFPSEGALLVETTETPEGYRYFSRDAARWIGDHKVRLFGSNSQRYDSGFKEPTGFFIELFSADIPIVANIINLDKLPTTEFELIVMPLRVRGVCTVPCRAVVNCG